MNFKIKKIEKTTFFAHLGYARSGTMQNFIKMVLRERKNFNMENVYRYPGNLKIKGEDQMGLGIISIWGIRI